MRAPHFLSRAAAAGLVGLLLTGACVRAAWAQDVPVGAPTPTGPGQPTPPPVQPGTLVTPSFSAGAFHDSNVFWRPSAEAETDNVWRFTPGVTVAHQSIHDTWGGTYSFDIEQYQDHPTLSTPLARQDATLFGQVVVAPHTTIDTTGQFDSTLAPSELNLTTGLIIGRVRATRWEASPDIVQDATSRLQLRGAYTVSRDDIDLTTTGTPAILTNVGTGQITFKADGRNDLLGEYRYERFDFGTGSAAIEQVALLGWTGRLTPFTTVTVKAGPRFGAGQETMPEVEATLDRRVGFGDINVSYARTATTAVGIVGLLDVQRVLVRALYKRPGGVQASLEAGAYDNVETVLGPSLPSTTAPFQAWVYHLGTALTVPLGGYVSLTSSYAFDFQRGGVSLLGTSTLPAVALPNGTISRQVVFVALTVSRPTAPTTGKVPTPPTFDRRYP